MISQLRIALIEWPLAQAAWTLVALGILVGNGALGWKYGVLRRFLVFLGLYVGVAIATDMTTPFATTIGGGRVSSVYTAAGIFILTLAAGVTIFEVLGALWADQLARVVTLAFGRVLGAISGVLLGVAQIALIVLVASAVHSTRDPAHPYVGGPDALANAITEVGISRVVTATNPIITTLFAPVLPPDMAAYLIQHT